MTSDYQMLNCIHEIPQGLANTFTNNDKVLPLLIAEIKEKAIRRVIVTGVGSSFTAAVIAQPVLAVFPTLPVHVLSTSDLHAYADIWIDHHTLVVAVSRSGERGWVVDALRQAAARGALCAAITANPNALLLEPAQYHILTGEGPELPFPKTKSVIACAGTLLQMGLAMSAQDDARVQTLKELLVSAPDTLANIIQTAEPQIVEQISSIAKHRNMLSGGTVSAYGAALEFSLKLQEAAQTQTSCWDSANLLHGPWGPHNGDWLVAMTSTAEDAELTRQSFRLAGGMGADCLAITTPDVNLEGTARYQFQVPAPSNPFLTGLFFLPVFQLLTYYWTTTLGLNPDAPHQTMSVLDAIVPAGRSEPEMKKD